MLAQVSSLRFAPVGDILSQGSSLMLAQVSSLRFAPVGDILSQGSSLMLAQVSNLRFAPVGDILSQILRDSKSRVWLPGKMGSEGYCSPPCQ